MEVILYICLLPLVLISQELVCHLCFWALSLFHATTLNPTVRANIMPFLLLLNGLLFTMFSKACRVYFSHSYRLKGTSG